MKTKLVQFIRIGVASAIGFLVALAAKQGLPALSPAMQDAVVGAIMAIVSPLYTQIVNWLEARFPWLGYLLGARYKKPKGVMGSQAR